MKDLFFWMPLALGYAVCMAGSHLLLKIAGQSSTGKGLMVFAFANGIGFLGMVLLPFALKKGPAALVYALAIGGGFALLQTVCWFLFPQPASMREVGGVCLIVAGLCLLASRHVNL
jgi:multidrug transporter EmrE-like cation transporter